MDPFAIPTPVPDLLNLDYNLPTLTDIELYDRIHARKEFEPLLALIVSASHNLCKEAAKVRNLACLEKPFALDDPLNMIQRLTA